MTAPDGPLARFAGDEVRPILRVSQNYAFLLEESFHPDLLRDALDRDRFFDRLWIQSMHGQRVPEIVKAERDDLLEGDLPRFTTRPGSTDIWTSAGTRIAGFFSESGLDAARRCLEQLGEEDFDWQSWLLHASLATTAKGAAAAAHAPVASSTPRAASPGSTWLDEADRIGDRLARLALRSGDEASWLGPTRPESGHYRTTSTTDCPAYACSSPTWEKRPAGHSTPSWRTGA
jgi:lantibiotic modifying enzyme